MTDPAGNPIYPGAIFDPVTGDVFPNNIIPAGRISSISQKIAGVYAQYYTPTFSDRTINNYPALRNADPQFHQTQLSFKYDWDITKKNRITSSYIYTLRPRYNADLVPSNAIWQAGSDNGGPLASGGVQTTVANAYRLSDTYTASSNLLNVLSLTFNSFQNKSVPFTSLSGNTNWPQEVGLGVEQSVANFPVITFGNTINGVGEGQIGNSYTPKSGYVAWDGPILPPFQAHHNKT